MEEFEKRIVWLEHEDSIQSKMLQKISDRLEVVDEQSRQVREAPYGGGAAPCGTILRVHTKNGQMTGTGLAGAELIIGATITGTQGSLTTGPVYTAIDTDPMSSHFGECYAELPIPAAGIWNITAASSRFTSQTTASSNMACGTSYDMFFSLIPATGYHSPPFGGICYFPAKDTLIVSDSFGDVTITYNGTSHTWIGCDTTFGNVANSSSTGNFTGAVCDVGNEATIARTYEWNGAKNIVLKWWNWSGAFFGACAGVPEGNTSCSDVAHSGHVLATAGATASPMEACGDPTSQVYSITAKIFAATVGTGTGTETVNLDE